MSFISDDHWRFIRNAPRTKGLPPLAKLTTIDPSEETSKAVQVSMLVIPKVSEASCHVHPHHLAYSTADPLKLVLGTVKEPSVLPDPRCYNNS